MDIQAMMDGMSSRWQKERAESQMTLGKMIDALASMPPDAKVSTLSHAHSYRGYYSDLAFKPGDPCQTRKASELLADCRAAMGEVFTGYKGGDYQMGRNTPVWVAHYGCCGLKLMGFNPDGTLATAEDA